MKILLFLVLGLCLAGAAKVSLAPARLDDARFLRAVVVVEDARGRRGAAGEFTAYQFRWVVWRGYTDATRADAARNPALADAVAAAHLDWIKRSLGVEGVRVDAYHCALAWNAGVEATVRGAAPARARDYAGRVVNVYEAEGERRAPPSPGLRRAGAVLEGRP